MMMAGTCRADRFTYWYVLHLHDDDRFTYWYVLHLHDDGRYMSPRQVHLLVCPASPWWWQVHVVPTGSLTGMSCISMMMPGTCSADSFTYWYVLHLHDDGRYMSPWQVHLLVCPASPWWWQVHVAPTASLTGMSCISMMMAGTCRPDRFTYWYVLHLHDDGRYMLPWQVHLLVCPASPWWWQVYVVPTGSLTGMSCISMMMAGTCRADRFTYWYVLHLHDDARYMSSWQLHLLVCPASPWWWQVHLLVCPASPWWWQVHLLVCPASPWWWQVHLLVCPASPWWWQVHVVPTGSLTGMSCISMMMAGTCRADRFTYWYVLHLHDDGRYMSCRQVHLLVCPASPWWWQVHVAPTGSLTGMSCIFMMMAGTCRPDRFTYWYVLHLHDDGRYMSPRQLHLLVCPASPWWWQVHVVLTGSLTGMSCISMMMPGTCRADRFTYRYVQCLHDDGKYMSCQQVHLPVCPGSPWWWQVYVVPTGSLTSMSRVCMMMAGTCRADRFTYRYVQGLHDDGRYMSRRQVQSDARLHLLHEFLRQRRLWRHLEEENDALLGPVFTPLWDAQTVHNLLDRLHCQNQ